MDTTTLLEVCKECERIIRNRSFPNYIPEPSRINPEQPISSQFASYSHLLWMLKEIPKLVESKRTEKAMRWLGFVQGALWANGSTTIQRFKDMNRSKKD